MLGAGFVAKPALEVLIRKDFNVTVGTKRTESIWRLLK